MYKHLPLPCIGKTRKFSLKPLKYFFRKYIFLSFSPLNLVLACVLLSRSSNTGAVSFVFPLLRDERHDHHYSKLPAMKIEAWKFH